MAPSELCYLTIAQAAAGLRRKDFSSVELTEACLQRIEAVDGKLHSFITVTDDLALTEARHADQELILGKDRGLLHGIPIALKDLYMTEDIRSLRHGCHARATA